MNSKLIRFDDKVLENPNVLKSGSLGELLSARTKDSFTWDIVLILPWAAFC